MFAIVETGGKQVRVEEGAKVKVELLGGEPGGEIVLDKVLLVANGQDVQIGAPYLASAKVACEIVGHGRGEKVIVFKKWRRHNAAKKMGHRQNYTTLKVKSISL